MLPSSSAEPAATRAGADFCDKIRCIFRTPPGVSRESLSSSMSSPQHSAKHEKTLDCGQGGGGVRRTREGEITAVRTVTECARRKSADGEAFVSAHSCMGLAVGVWGTVGFGITWAGSVDGPPFVGGLDRRPGVRCHEFGATEGSSVLLDGELPMSETASQGAACQYDAHRMALCL